MLNQRINGDVGGRENETETESSLQIKISLNNKFNFDWLK